ncbi:MAG: hypothetical protein H5T70_09200, partial [Chloroflexi bacterium]|nr:hypothetical protein [Chloroflexota bacterium]
PRMNESGPRIVFPFLLIVGGVILLLDRLGVWAIPWESLIRWWPLLLVLVGLDLILGGTRVGRWVLLALAIGLIGALLYWAPRFETGGTYTAERFSHPVEGVQRAEVRLQLGVGQLEVAALEEGSPQLYEADLRYDRRYTHIVHEVSTKGADLEVLLKSDHRAWVPTGDSQENIWVVRLSRRVPLRLEITSGVSRSRVDLTGLALTQLDFNGGVGEVEVRLSERAPYQASVKGGVGALTIQVPQGVEARFRIEGGLGEVTVGPRFEKQGAYYITQ